MPRIGGTLPDSYGLSASVYVPTATTAAPIAKGQPLTFADTGGYHAAAAAAGATVELIAKHGVEDGQTPLGVYVVGFSRIDELKYTGDAPAIGGSVEADGAGAYRAALADNGTRVLYVDTARMTVDVAY